jgi:hypothetical protein
MLSRLSLTPLPKERLLLRIVSVRLASDLKPAKPGPARIQFQKPANEQGTLKYERYYSRDP